MVKGSASSSTNGSGRSSNAPHFWRPTKMMNMRDLSRDDDFLSHLLVEKLGTGAVPLIVHRMDSSRRLPKTDAHDLLRIVQRLVINSAKSPIQHVIRQAVDELIQLAAIRYYIRDYTQQQINAFATHASRYCELYHPSGLIEIAHTSRYAHRTGKSELCILATRKLAPGTVITELKGSMADLTEDECRELKRTDLRSCDIRRDFSVIHSKSMKKDHLFLGPARFVNHDCGHNCELFRTGRYITFRVIKPISIGEEITAHYGNGYFGRNNRHCLCASCEKAGKGGYLPTYEQDVAAELSGSDSDSDVSSDEEVVPVPTVLSGPNERRTRRKTYPIVQEVESDDSEDEVASELVDVKQITPPADDEVEMESSQRSTPLPTLLPTGLARASPLPAQTPSPRRSSRLSSRTDLEPLPETQAGSSKEKPVLQSQSSSTNKAKEKSAVAKKEPEGRSRRGGGALEEHVAPKVVAMGKDGKPLPTCVTCEKVLPVISIDSKVVWGVFDGLARGKSKEVDLHCPRCMRHYAIYRQHWPNRVCAPGTTALEPSPPPSLSTSSLLNRRVLPVFQKKLTDAARVRELVTSDDEEPPPKRRRANSDPPVPKAAASSSVASRAPAPSLPRKNPVDPKTGKPKRGRPRNQPVETESLPVDVKIEDEDTPGSTDVKAQDLQNQPREGNGRFGKKEARSEGAQYTQPALSRFERAAERERRKEQTEPSASFSKRTRASLGSEHDTDGDGTKRFRPLLTSREGYRVGLELRPNPQAFSQKTWRSHASKSDSSAPSENSLTSEDSDGLITPSVASEPAASPLIVGADINLLHLEEHKQFLLVKPSPLAFARRRWSSSSMNAVDDFDSQTLTTTGMSRTVLDITTSSKRTESIFSALSKTYPLPVFDGHQPWLATLPLSAVKTITASEPHVRPSTPAKEKNKESRVSTIVTASPSVLLSEAWAD